MRVELTRRVCMARIGASRKAGGTDLGSASTIKVRHITHPTHHAVCLSDYHRQKHANEWGRYMHGLKAQGLPLKAGPAARFVGAHAVALHVILDGRPLSSSEINGFCELMRALGVSGTVGRTAVPVTAQVDTLQRRTWARLTTTVCRAKECAPGVAVMHDGGTGPDHSAVIGTDSVRGRAGCRRRHDRLPQAAAAMTLAIAWTPHALGRSPPCRCYPQIQTSGPRCYRPALTVPARRLPPLRRTVIRMKNHRLGALGVRQMAGRWGVSVGVL